MKKTKKNNFDKKMIFFALLCENITVTSYYITNYKE